MNKTRRRPPGQLRLQIRLINMTELPRHKARTTQTKVLHIETGRIKPHTRQDGNPSQAAECISMSNQTNACSPYEAPSRCTTRESPTSDILPTVAHHLRLRSSSWRPCGGQRRHSIPDRKPLPILTNCEASWSGRGSGWGGHWARLARSLTSDLFFSFDKA